MLYKFIKLIYTLLIQKFDQDLLFNLYYEELNIIYSNFNLFKLKKRHKADKWY